MGILNSITEKIFGKRSTEVKPSVSTPSAASADSVTAAIMGAASNQAAAAMAAARSNAKTSPVDVEAILEVAVKTKGVKLNWRESIIDLMKALDLDSSLAARKELAADLKYSGAAPDGSVEKNIWLHKTLMKVIAENGGKIPKELLD
jgi:hypothetical protein